MDISSQMNSNTLKMVSTPISCRRTRCKAAYTGSYKLAMQRDSKHTNLYQVLSLSDSQNVGFEDIKKAYRSLALQYHPDVCPSSRKEESTRRFVELQKAYETLSDPVSRRLYDSELGLGDSLGFMCVEDRGDRFPKDVWEKQLSGLKQRSRIRRERKMNYSM